MIKCNECGYENMDGLDYCDSCGVKLNSAAGAAQLAAGLSDAPTGDISPAAVPLEKEPAPAEADSAKPAVAADSVPLSEPAPIPEPAPAVEPPPAPGPTPAAGAPTFKAKLKLVRGGRTGNEFPLESGNNLVGRWDPETGSFPEVDLEADDPEAKISRKHALIRLDGSKITIEDIGSLNGTYVNRQPRLTAGTPQDLKDGDEIIIGKTFFKVIVEPVS
ncbi:MAG TPA: FHA domain-containing protein [Candidatus Binataceae bacterium]|jgi:hypothetical protein